jgi:rhomboid protease GluP
MAMLVASDQTSGRPWTQRNKGCMLCRFDSPVWRVEVTVSVFPSVSASEGESGELAPAGPEGTAARLREWWLAARRKPVTCALIALCVLCWGLANLWGRDSDSILWYLGANNGRAVRSGEIYRLLSCLFLHLGWVHLLLNMIALRALSALESMLGSRRFLLLYFLSGLGASLSTALLRPDVLSVGASGAIWGLMGAAFGMRIPTRHVLRARGVPLSAGWHVLVLNLGISFVPGVDLSAHLGGGIVGFVLGAVAFYPDYGPRLPVTARAPWSQRLYTLATALALLIVAVALATALFEGRPWRFVRPPRLQRVALGSTGLSVEVPEPLDREPLPLFAGEGDGWRLGVPGRSPLAVKLALDRPLDANDPGGVSPARVENWLSTVRAEIEREPADADLPRTALELTSLGERRAVRDEYRTQDRQVVRYFEYVGRYPVVIAIARFDGWRRDLWPGIEARIAASVRDDGAR